MVAVCLLPVALFGAENLKPTEEQEYVTRYMARFFPRQHLTHRELEDSISERVWNNYLNRLDYERIFFLQSDIDLFKKKIHELDDSMKMGDLSFAFEVFDVFRARLTNRCAYVNILIEKDFDFSLDESYTWQRKHAAWAADEDESNEIWRKRIKNEFLRRKISEVLKEETPEDEKPAPATNKVDEAVANIVPPTPKESIGKRYKHLATIIQDSDSDYVVQKYLTAFANAYDPHSSYLAPAALDDFDIEMKLSLVGIGAVLQAEDGAAKVIRLIAGGPASQDKREQALCAGDKIIAVGQGDQEPVDMLHWPLTKMVQKIRGKKGSKVVLVVIPASDPSGSTVKTVDLIRDEVKLEEQAVKWTLHTTTTADKKEHRLAVIDVPAFYANLRAKKTDPDYRSSADDVEKALEEIATNNIDGVILDLRNNGGGSLIDSVRMTGLFIPEGPAVQIKESSSRGRILTDDDDRTVYKGPLVVMMNRLSASASEIVAAALKDYGRAVLVGDSRTHGKGTVQTVVNVGRQPIFGAIKLTTAVFYRISGDSTQLRGVIPDIYIPSPLDHMELGEDSLKYPVEWNRIRGCNYREYDDLGDEIDEIREKSVERRKNSEQFKVYGKLLDQMKSIYETDDVPLNLEARLKVARAEKEIVSMQRKLAEREDDEKPNGTDDKRNDLVLEEGLQILADFVSLDQRAMKELDAEIKAEEEKSLVEKVKGWIKDEQ